MTTVRRRYVIAVIALLMAVIVVLVLQRFSSATPTGSLDLSGDTGGSQDIRLGNGLGSFVINGSLDTLLSPGRSASLDLELRNPLATAIVVAGIDVTVDAVDAPNATELLPCSDADFGVRGWAPSASVPGLSIEANATMTLSELGAPSGAWPLVEMLESGTNQNGCKGASLALSYQGTAEVSG